MRHLAVLAALVLAAPAGAIESAYTRLDPQGGCVGLSTPSGAGSRGRVELRCPGWRDYAVHYAEAEGRVSLAYGFAPASRPWRGFAGSSRVHHTVEWRLHGSGDRVRPLATIHRWFVAAPGGGEAQVLVISRVWQPDGTPGCPVGYVDAGANADANRLAREIADRLAPRFACGQEAPFFYGLSTATTPRPAL